MTDSQIAYAGLTVLLAFVIAIYWSVRRIERYLRVICLRLDKQRESADDARELGL